VFANANDGPAGTWPEALTTSRAAETAANLFQTVSDVLASISLVEFTRAVQLMHVTRRQRRRVYVIGNGGSASTAAHLACDLARGQGERRNEGLRIFALSENTSVLTAWANDRSYERVFAEQLAGLLDPNDLVVAISVSGRSPNIIEGLRVAREAGGSTIGLLGMDGGLALQFTDISILVRCSDFSVVETVHLAVVHAFAIALGTSRSSCLSAAGAVDGVLCERRSAGTNAMKLSHG
jgi:D-sedoheptulose 7-phosphate isomerase